MKRVGFTLIELVISLTLTAALIGTVVFVFITCFRAWDAGAGRSGVRTEIAQAFELMTKNLRHARSIDAIAEDSITFTADLGAGEAQYRYHVYLPDGADAYQLLKGLGTDAVGQGAVLVHGVQATSVFSQAGQLIAIDLTADNEGSTVHMRTNVRPRNL